MKSFYKLSIAFGVMIILFSSCGKNNEAGKMIPGNALFVAQLTMKSLNSKLSWDQLKQTAWYQKAYSNASTPDWRKKILDNPSASGIDFDNGLTFFVSKGNGNDYFLAAEGKIKNENDFEQFNKNFDSSQAVTKEDGINLLILKDKNVVGWKDKDFVYVMNPETTASEMYRWKDSSKLQPDMPVDKSAELSEFCKKLFSLKTDSSLANNDKFSSLLKENGDIHLWQNNEAIINSRPDMGILGMVKLDAFIKDNISTYTVNFDKGEIDVNQKSYVSKDLADVLKKYMGNSINMDMIKNIPSQNILGLLAFNFKPEGLVQLIKLTGADGLVNSFSQKMGFGLDDISKATNGDFLLAFTDFKMNKSLLNSNDSGGNLGNLNKPDFNYIFSVGVGDKASLQKIIDGIKKMGSQMGKDSFVNNYVMNDKTFAIGSSLSFANQYLAGNNNKYEFTDKFSGHPVGFFLDIHKILSQFATTESANADDKAMLDKSLNMWNNITAYGGDFKDNAFTFHTEINLINKDTSSLKQLSDYINAMYKINEAKKDENNNKLDSLLVPPPIDTVK
ncbi:MAG TPA: DUF4836 family protein [Hanamia sp.]|nr:DUF4836 family protein [Hanamia sp.]